VKDLTRLFWIVVLRASNIIFSQHNDEFDLEENGIAIGMGGTGGLLYGQFKKIDSLQIGGFRFHNINAKEITFNFNCAEDIYGIMGIGVMRHLTWQIDFKNKIILVTKEAEKLSYSENKIVIPLNENPYSHHLRTKLQLNGHSKSIDVLVDIGNSGVLNIGEDYLLSDPPDIQSKKISGKVSYGLGGTVNGEGREKVYLFDSLIFKKGNVGFGNIPVMTTPDGIDLLGLGFMNKFKTTLNWKNQTLTLDPYEINQDFVWKTLGCLTKFDKERNQTIIKAVIDDTQAAKAGVPTNATVISINDVTFTGEQSYCTYLNSLKDHPIENDTIRLKLAHEGSVKSYDLIYEPVFSK